MAVSDLIDWMDEFGRPGVVWFAKRLAANDTKATGAKQAGPYFPKEFLFELFPTLNRPTDVDPDLWFNLRIDSDGSEARVRAVWYNAKIRARANGDKKKNLKDEARITNFGGIKSPLLNPDNTGTVAVFAFVFDAERSVEACHVWVCGEHGAEAAVVEERLGPIEPRLAIVWQPGVAEPEIQNRRPSVKSTCWLSEDEIPEQWFLKFPTGMQVIEKTLLKRPSRKADVDARLLLRRECEYEIFRSVEQASWLPKIRTEFETIDAFLGIASSILQSRKSRAGKSLEYHVQRILREEGLRSDLNFAYNPCTEGRKQPDFIFPSVEAYRDPSFPQDRLRMLATKTTCKDRWRQITKEADRIKVKHLLTLQQGVSKTQFEEMCDAEVKLVVPAGLHKSYPKTVRPKLMTLAQFIDDVRSC